MAIEYRADEAFRTNRQVTNDAASGSRVIPLGGGEFLLLEGDNAGSTLELIRVEDDLTVTLLSQAIDWLPSNVSRFYRRTDTAVALGDRRFLIIHYDNGSPPNYYAIIMDMSGPTAVEESRTVIHSGTFIGRVAGWHGLWQRPDGVWSVMILEPDQNSNTFIRLGTFEVSGSTVTNISTFPSIGQLARTAPVYGGVGIEPDGTTWIFCGHGYIALVDRVTNTVLNLGTDPIPGVHTSRSDPLLGPISIPNGKMYRPYWHDTGTPTADSSIRLVTRSGSNVTYSARETLDGNVVDFSFQAIDFVNGKFILTATAMANYEPLMIEFREGDAVAEADSTQWVSDTLGSGDYFDYYPDVAIWSGDKVIIVYEDLNNCGVFTGKAPAGFAARSINARSGGPRVIYGPTR